MEKYYFKPGEIFEMNGRNYITCICGDESCGDCDMHSTGYCCKFACMAHQRADHSNVNFIDIGKMPKQKIQDEPAIDRNVDYREEYNILREKYDALLEEMKQYNRPEPKDVKGDYDPVLEEKIIPELEKWFDWDRVCTMMNSVGWVYAGEKTPLSEEVIKKYAFDHVRYAYKHKTTTECGGFKVQYIPAKEAAMAFGYDEEEAEEKAVYDTVKLSFIGESWDTSFCNE